MNNVRKKSNSMQYCICMMLSFILVLALSFTSFAAANAEELKKTVTKVFNDSKTTDEQKQDILSELDSTQDGSTVASDQQVTITVDGNTYIFAANGSVATSTKNTIQAIYDTNHAGDKSQGASDPKVAAGIDAITGGFDVSANTEGAMKSMEGFLPLIQGLTGVLAVITILGLGIFTAFDVIYLAFPVAKGKMDASAQAGAANGGSMVTGKNHQTGEAKFVLVTDDAQAAYAESAQAGNKQPWIPYLKRRWLTYVLCSVIIYILLSGNMAIFINWALSAISGLLDTLATYA